MNPEQVLASIDPLAGGDIVRELEGGPASHSFLVRNGGADYVLRLDKPVARMLGLDRESEAQVLATASAAGVGPRLVFVDAGTGVLVTRYIEGRPWSERDIVEDDALRRLAVLLRRVHALPSVGRPFGLPYKIAAYAQAIGTPKADELAMEALDILDSLSDGESDPCLCHNDVTCANVIEGDGLALIDWEYAAIGDRFFDLATIVQHHGLDDAQAITVLRCYQGQVYDEDIFRLQRWCEVYGRVSALWTAAIEQFNRG